MQPNIYVAACVDERPSYLDGGAERNVCRVPYSLTILSATCIRFQPKIRKCSSYLVGPGSNSRPGNRLQ
jgi:hypothetical protein